MRLSHRYLLVGQDDCHQPVPDFLKTNWDAGTAALNLTRLDGRSSTWTSCCRLREQRLFWPICAW
jgi:hypothetical protein